MNKTKMPFGYHLMIDCYNCNKKIIDSISNCYDFLDQLVDYINMTKQAPPYIFRTPKEYIVKSGLSGGVPLVESGISILTLTKKQFVSIDVYSCSQFSIEKVKKFVSIFFKTTDLELNFVQRGTKYYQKTQ